MNSDSTGALHSAIKPRARQVVRAIVAAKVSPQLAIGRLDDPPAPNQSHVW